MVTASLSMFLKIRFFSKFHHLDCLYVCLFKKWHAYFCPPAKSIMHNQLGENYIIRLWVHIKRG